MLEKPTTYHIPWHLPNNSYLRVTRGLFQQAIDCRIKFLKIRGFPVSPTAANRKACCFRQNKSTGAETEFQYRWRQRRI
jgi:hypothetical protein